MDKNNDVKIKQINPQTKLSDLEKTAILEFRLEAEEELSKMYKYTELVNEKDCYVFDNNAEYHDNCRKNFNK